MPSVSAGKPFELSYLDRSILDAETALAYDQGIHREAIETAVATRLGGIKSLQVVSISFAVGDTSKNATISAVTTSKTLILPLGSSGNSNTIADFGIRLSWVNSTTINAVRQTNGEIRSQGFQVIEFL